jgi:hypothetical protein
MTVSLFPQTGEGGTTMAEGHRRHCCLRAEGVTDEYQSGGWFHSEGDENGSKGPIVNAV